MIIPLLARQNRVRQTSSTFYTGTGGSQTVQTNVDASGGVLIFANRDTSVFSGMVFGDDLTKAIRMGGGNTPWSSGEQKAISGLTLNSRSISITSAFDWNVSGQDYVVWSIAGSQCDVVTWIGSGGSGVTVSHALGVAPWAAIVTRLVAGTVQDVFWFTQSNAADYTRLRTGIDLGTDVFTSASTTQITWEGAFDLSGSSYKAVLFPQSTSFMAAGDTAPFTLENLGWRPQFVFMDWPGSGFASFDFARDGTGGSDNSSDLSTTLNDSTSGTDTGTNTTLQVNGMTIGTATAVNYLAFR